MSINFNNTNTVWASILAETLWRLGLKTAVVCPGSRSAPLTVAFAQHPEIEAISVLDERSAAFFALGIARQQYQPVVLVCTSGTAGANFYPAVIEATENRVPLLIMTADRPPELRDCGAGQAIDQHKLYGTFPNWQIELALPSVELSLLTYLRQVLVHAWERCQYPISGVVHLNIPFRDPLAPIPEARAQALTLTFDFNQFFAHLVPTADPQPYGVQFPTYQAGIAGIIVAGAAQPQYPDRYCRAIAQLAQVTGFPVLAEGLSPLRNYADLNPNLIASYDLILRNPTLAETLTPEVVIRIGEMPTSKQLRSWLEETQSRQWVIDPSDRNLDPLHGQTTHLRVAIEALSQPIPSETQPLSLYLKLWWEAEAYVQKALAQTMTKTIDLFEGKAAWLLAQTLPHETPIFISSSMPVRDVEFFWTPSNSHVRPFFNRGANGIDGSLSTALGIAHQQQPSVMLTGDLALLHDTNGFLLRQHFQGHLTIVLINNNGGGIFEMLPIAQFDPPFETYFATPQSIDFAQLCATYSVKYELITQWDQLQQRLNPLPINGIRVLELRTDRKADAQWRQINLSKFAADFLTS